MGIIHINHEGKDESAPLVHAWWEINLEIRCSDDSHEHAFIGSDGESEVEKVRRVGEMGDHGRGKVELSQIWRWKQISKRHKPANDGFNAHLSAL
jgi:hypothetical protein